MTAVATRPPTVQKGGKPMRQTATPDEIRAAIRHLEALGTQEFADALARCIMAPRGDRDDLYEDSEEPISKYAADRAFRSTILVDRSIAAAELLIRQARNRTAREGGNSRDRQRRMQHYMDLVGIERRLLEDVRKGYRAQQGIVDNERSPQNRALRRLKQLNLKDDVPKGTYNRLLAEEKEKDRIAREAAAKERRAKRRASRP